MSGLFKKLRTRLIAHIVLIVVLITSVSFLAAFKLHQQALEVHLSSDVHVASEILENMLITVMEVNELNSLRRILPELAKLRHLNRIRIIHPEGRIVFSSDPNEVGSTIVQAEFADFINSDSAVLTNHFKDHDVTLYQRWRKIYNEKRCQKCHDPLESVNGVSWVETADTVTFASLRSYFFMSASIAVGVIALLSFSTYFLFIRAVDRPIQELQKTMARIRNGDFSARVNMADNSELGQLGSGFNLMASKLQVAHKHLMEHHQQELEQAESIAKIGELAAGVAHEIKNPISGIVFAVNSIIRETDNDDPQKEIFEEIVKQAHKVEQNLEDLLSFARHNRLERFPTDINEIVKRICLFISQQPDMKNIIIESKLDPKLPELLVDPKQIEQVILNLIINAVHAMPDGGLLTTITTRKAASEAVQILIKDTGVGIPMHDQHKIFQPFFTTRPDGVGLGLSLCKDIVTRHKGSIYFESKLGEGTTFTVELPIGHFKNL